MNLIDIIIGIGVVQGTVIAGVLLYVRSGHRLANRFIAALVLATAALLLQRLLIRWGVFNDYPQFSLLLQPLRFTWAPLLYLYALSITGVKLNGRQAWHFLPAVLFFALANLKFWQLDADQQRLFTTHLWSFLGSSPSSENIIWGFMGSFWRLLIEFHVHMTFFTIQSVTYCFLVLKLIKSHNRRLEQHFSSMEKMNLRWLRLLTISFLVFLVLLLVFNRIPLLLNLYDTTAPLANAYAVLLVILFYGIAISALLQPSLISGVVQARESEPSWAKKSKNHSPASNTEPTKSNDDLPAAAHATPEMVENDRRESNSKAEPLKSNDDLPAAAHTIAEIVEEDVVEPNSKYKRSRMSSEDGQRYRLKLMKVIQEQELYLNPELTLPELAEAAGLTAPQASQVLNGQMNQNFFSFVNSYRIDLARNMLIDPDTADIPIVELAVEVGFKSKSSFYDAFKRVTGMTPTQFKRAVEV
ncbi:hypothetical protein SIN8267_00765 [Sinobacterium norvegicum]|uniref:HTH araC/xylS-type domain-containing protein n=1 Tax=Sinobacterium norvegicum TaxID=1641715 RepID=A0ABM9ABT9_9GAMM|nr:helix-turn-helix domain-containing protein [Sinobacterium norvegicum]CAH0990671.1 hypothetical protein SIN8267_00765 [Sinobacterium norvegicum]